MPSSVSPPPFSVVAVTPVFNRRELTLDSLRTLYSCDLTGISLHVVVVDDGSSDGTAEAIARVYPMAEVVRGDGTLFYAGGMNAGIAAALHHDPDFILGFNNDTRFPFDCLRQLVACARAHEGAIVGPLLLDWDTPHAIFQVAPEFEVSYGGWRHWYRQTLDTAPDRPFEVESIAGNCVLFPAAALRENEWMRAARLPHWGDTELTVRLKRRGWTLLIEPRAHLLNQPNTPPARISEMTVAAKMRSLLWARESTHSLPHRFWHTWWTAPGRVSAVAAFATYVARFAMRGAGVRSRWPNDLEETPLRDRVRPVDAATGDIDGRGVEVWYAWPYPEWGGVQFYLLAIAEEARKRGFSIAVLIPSASAPELRALLDRSGVRVETFASRWDDAPATTVARRIERRRGREETKKEMVRRLRSLTRDSERRIVIHADFAPWSDADVMREFLEFADVIATIHTPLGRAGRLRAALWRRELASLFRHRRFSCLSETHTAKRSLWRYVDASALARIDVSRALFSGEEIDRILRTLPSRKLVERELDLPPSAFRVGVTGQMIERKGFATLAEAVGMCAAEGLEAQVLWCGPGTPDGAVSAAIERAGGRFHWRRADSFGGDPRRALPAIRAACDAFALPSYEEGLPLSLVEAMAMGMPCIATRVGAMPEAIRHERSGLLVPARDARALADSFVLLAADRGLAARLGEAAKLEAWERFEQGVSALPTLRAYVSF